MTQMKNNLDNQITEARRTIASDGYAMSIGELTTLYREGELIIRPEFQRLFRWKAPQKSRLIESILIGIPLPSIFVAQQEMGKWELVDGLQRVSTILELQGELLDENGSPMSQLVLEKTRYLPDLEGRTWDGSAGGGALTEPLKLDIKRSKIDIKIIKRDSSPEAKYDLFQRLNSYGSVLTAQELRSSMLVGTSLPFFKWIESLSKYPKFVHSTSLSERQIKERYDLELVLRFIILHNLPSSRIKQSVLKDFNQFMDDESISFALAHPGGNKEVERVFKATFDYMDERLGEDSFKKWDPTKNVFTGVFLNTAFEVFALGIGFHLSNHRSVVGDIVKTVQSFWAQPNMIRGYATGRSTEARLADFVPQGRVLTKGP